MCADLYTYKTNFEPIFLPGETAHLITATDAVDVACIALGALPEYTKDFGALTAGAWSTDNEDTNLEMNSFEMSQLRMRVVDDIKLRFNNLAPTRQWRTSGIDFYLPQFPPSGDDNFLKEFLFKASEFFIYGDDTPRFDFYSGSASATSRVKFSGWRFRVKRLPAGSANPRMTIWVSGWPSGSAA